MKLSEMEKEWGPDRYVLQKEDDGLFKKWDAFKEAVTEMTTIIKNHALELHNKNPGS
jgi:hypothetical protein